MVARNGGLAMNEYTKVHFKNFLKDNEGMRFEMVPLIPESNKMRRWFEGGLVSLITYYQEGMSHRNAEDKRKVREFLKAEFNGEVIVINGEKRKIAKTTKGRPELNLFVERVVDWLVENYAPPPEALDTKKYQDWYDTILPFSKPDEPDNYIDYLITCGILKR